MLERDPACLSTRPIRTRSKKTTRRRTRSSTSRPPEADAQEQHADVAPHRDEPLHHFDPAAANEADRAEQARVVELDEDDYR
ncbi:hypothetical protein GCM10020000_27850 [Streptomyces olivoverticillatus]